MEKLYIVIPAYNEEENIKNVIDEWYQVVEKYHCEGQSRLVIIDDGSKDSTFQIMEEYAKDKPLFLPMTKTNSGHGATVLFGYQYALESGATHVFQTDSDGQTLPEEFHQFWEQRADYDIILGNRSVRGDGFSRVFVTKVLKAVVWVLFKENLTDINTPFRLMSAETLKKVVTFVPKDYNLSNVIITVVYAKMKCKMKFIPITFRERQGGVNSINLKRIVGIGKQAVVDFRAIQKNLKENCHPQNESEPTVAAN